MAPRKRQSTTTQPDTAIDDSTGNEHHQRKKAKHTPAAAAAAHSPSTNAPRTDSNGDPYWEISRQRRVTVSSFKGRTMINIREYYEKDGQDLPGKKFNALVGLLPNLEEVVKQKGGVIMRPEYGGDAHGGGGDEEMEEEEQEQKAKRKKVVPPEKNIEATSEESEEED
ncbi:hypothetical protein PRK78_003409 [Emydomyces testavorans]|uniref:Transcriptional coactivator p15 (PC4) C-terminal domain-containing protein n=1 Tax=Emydomyces testavorans TaxID=2070801 RepID=A0AAF0IIH7_9EURO|nr:hypothetical protein PRK78_003409 [Emydomyces testavorans]